MVGASLDKICINDEVRFAEKYWHMKTSELENRPMIVISTDGLREPTQNSKSSRTITLYDKENC